MNNQVVRQERFELEVEGVNFSELTKHISIVPVQNPLAQSESSRNRSTPSTEANSSVLERNALYLNMMPRYEFTHQSTTALVEFTSCMSGGIIAYVYSSVCKTQLLGHVKVNERLQDAKSLQAVCKMHKPSGQCSCWVSCKAHETKQQVMVDLLKWFIDGIGKDKKHHQQSSVDVRVSHGMRVRSVRA